MKLAHIIHIEAPPDRVWAVTANIECWPEWTPTVDAVKRLDQGAFDVGSTALLKQPGLPEAKWSVTALTPRERFTWESRILGMRFIATHEMAATETGTRNELHIEISGLVALCLGPIILSSIRRSLEQENTGLKKRCETMDSST